MKKLFIDTNIVIDLLAAREPFYKEAAQLFSLADKRVIELNISTLTFANTNYILLKGKTSLEARQILRKLKMIVKILPLDIKIIDLSLNDINFNDFEDAMQYFSAHENNNEINSL